MPKQNRLIEPTNGKELTQPTSYKNQFLSPVSRGGGNVLMNRRQAGVGHARGVGRLPRDWPQPAPSIIHKIVFELLSLTPTNLSIQFNRRSLTPQTEQMSYTISVPTFDHRYYNFVVVTWLLLT